jgi:mono/diheme cytochrome c family protein
MRLQHARWDRHAGVMLATCFVLLAAAAAGGSEGRPPRQLAAAPPDGSQVFRTYCASCHGVTATGNGPAAVAMRVMPPDLTLIAKRNNGMFPAERVRQIIEGKGVAAHGERNMPVWGDVFSRKIGGRDPHALLDAVVHYLDGIQERPGD